MAGGSPQAPDGRGQVPGQAVAHDAAGHNHGEKAPHPRRGVAEHVPQGAARNLGHENVGLLIRAGHAGTDEQTGGGVVHLQLARGLHAGGELRGPSRRRLLSEVGAVLVEQHGVHLGRLT